MPPAPANQHRSLWQDLLNGAAVQGRVIHALILREMQTAHGRSNIGYLWALVEPLALLGMFLALFYYRGTTQHAGMNLVSFLTTGIMPYVALRTMAKQISSAIDANKGLLLYPQVTPADTMIARALLQGATMLIVFLIITFGSWLIGHGEMPHDWLGVLEALGAMALLALSIGLLQNALIKTFPPIKHVLTPLWRMLLFTSCVFYMMRDLPLTLQEIVWYNPIAHAIEMLRHSFFLGFQSPIEDYTYIIGWSIVSLFIGLIVERVYRYRDVAT